MLVRDALEWVVMAGLKTGVGGREQPAATMMNVWCGCCVDEHDTDIHH